MAKATMTAMWAIAAPSHKGLYLFRDKQKGMSAAKIDAFANDITLVIDLMCRSQPIPFGILRDQLI